jgi:hypothetical protein
MNFNFPSDINVQSQLAQHLQRLRKQQKLSRHALEKISTVPAPTIKKFETTGQISLRQFLLLWECLDNIDRLAMLANQRHNAQPQPTTIEQVLADEF